MGHRLFPIRLLPWLLAFAGPVSAAASIDPSSPTVQWTEISYPTLQPDFADDQQTGITEADIVGDLANPAFYTIFDDQGNADPSDDQIGFRVRLGADKNPLGFEHFFAVGLDVDLDGALDLFLGVDNSGNSDALGIFDAGTGANTSPSTTSIVSMELVSYTETAANYAFEPVTLTNDPAPTVLDMDADGNTDHFLSFVIPFADVVAQLGLPGFGPNSAVRYVAGTSTQPNALNQDLGGPDGGTSSSLTWEQLGAVSDTFTASGQPVPEPDSAALLAMGLVLLAAARPRRHGGGGA